MSKTRLVAVTFEVDDYVDTVTFAKILDKSNAWNIGGVNLKSVRDDPVKEENRLFFVQLVARAVPGMIENYDRSKPYRIFTYVVMARSAEYAKNLVLERNAGMVTVDKNWSDMFCYAIDTQGSECAEAVFVTSCDVSENAIRMIKERRSNITELDVNNIPAVDSNPRIHLPTTPK